MKKSLHLEKQEYFRYIGLIRKTMENTLGSCKTLGEEIEFVKEYLKFESNRFIGTLNWEMKIHPGVNMGIIVPGMLIKVFVENALKHGIQHKTGGGKVEILVHPTSLGILIMITDDGVGMVKATEFNRETGNGLRILDNYLRSFNRHHMHTIGYQLLDRGSPGKGTSGTRVLISIVFRREPPEYPSDGLEKDASGPGMAE